MFSLSKFSILVLLILDIGINAKYLRKHLNHPKYQDTLVSNINIDDDKIKSLYSLNCDNSQYSEIKALDIFNCDNKPFCELKVTFNNNSNSEYWLLSKRISDEL